MTVLTVFDALTNAYMQYVDNRNHPVLATSDERLAYMFISERYVAIKPLLEQFMSVDISFRHFEQIPCIMGFMHGMISNLYKDDLRALWDQHVFHEHHGIPAVRFDDHDVNKILSKDYPDSKKNSRLSNLMNETSANMVRLYRLIHEKFPNLPYGFDETSSGWPGFRTDIDPRTVT